MFAAIHAEKIMSHTLTEIYIRYARKTVSSVKSVDKELINRCHRETDSVSRFTLATIRMKVYSHAESADFTQKRTCSARA